MSETQKLVERLAALELKINSFAAEHTEFRRVHVSRRGLEGGRGERGEAGPAGPQGKDGDVTEAVEAAKRAMQAELQTAVLAELQKAGAVDSDGKAILIPGPVGPKGDSIAGPKGDSIIGPTGKNGVDGKPGRDAKIAIGSVASGPTASVTMREHDGVHIFDFVLPKGDAGKDGAEGKAGVSNIPGPQGDQGEQGPEGPQGVPGEGLSKREVIELVLDMKRRKSI